MDYVWKGCVKLETVAWALTALCWRINTSYRVTVTLHSSTFTYSWHSALRMTCSLRRSPWGKVSWLQPLFSLLSHYMGDFCWVARQHPKVCPGERGSGMCSLCTELENLARWHFPFLRSFPECSLDALSSFTALLLTSWQEGRLRGKRCISPFVAPSPPSVLH